MGEGSVSGAPLADALTADASGSDALTSDALTPEALTPDALKSEALTSEALTGDVPLSGGPIVGVLGGMGPAATVDFLGKLVEATPARTDQEHLRVLLWSDPSVPDRSAA